MRPVREQGVGRHRCPGTVRGTCMQCGVHSGEGTEDRVAPGRRREPPQRWGLWGVAAKGREQGCAGTPEGGMVDGGGLGMRMRGLCLVSCPVDTPLTAVSACLSFLPAGPGLHSCVHLPSSSRASCQRYWSPVFLRFLFPALLRDQVPAVGSLGHCAERRVSSRGARGSPGGGGAWKVRDKQPKGRCPEFGGLERSVLGGNVLLSFPGDFRRTLQPCEESLVFLPPHPGSWGYSLPDLFYLSVLSWTFGPGPMVGWASASSRPLAGFQA